jgi:predicted PurR-regulated permease PerM
MDFFKGNEVLTATKDKTQSWRTYYLFFIATSFIAMLLAFIDASWLTHKGVQDNESAAITVGAISLVIFLILTAVAAVGIYKHKVVLEKLEQIVYTGNFETPSYSTEPTSYGNPIEYTGYNSNIESFDAFG